MKRDARDILTLTTGGYAYEGWTSVSVTRSVEQAVSTFSVSLAADPTDLPIRVGEPCEIDIGSTRVITGYLDIYSPGHGATNHEINVTGRSRTCDLVDCSIVTEPPQFKNRTLTDIASVLAAPYGVTVVDAAGLDTVIPRFVTETGESPFSAIERLARDQAVLVTDDEEGRLVLCRIPDLALDPPTLEHPGNILSASLTADASGRFTEYRVKGQTVGNDETFGESVAGVESLVEDDDLSRYRCLIIRGEKAMSPADAKRRATWEAVTRAGRSAQVEVSVRGWRDQYGALWTPNTIAHVKDPVIGVDADLLVVSVTFSYYDWGQRTSLTLAPPGAYLPEPPIEQRRTGRKRKVTSGIAPWKELEGGV